MNAREREELIGPYLTQVRELITRLQTRESFNSKVCSPDFLQPTVEYGDLPLEDVRGEFHYYTQIEIALTAGLKIGAIPARFFDYVVRAPKEIADLVERSDERVA